MMAHDNAYLRREILKTLNVAGVDSGFQVDAVVEALRGSGFPELTKGSFMAQARYLEGKGYVAIKRTMNFLTKEEGLLASITPEGMDLLEGRPGCADPGVSCE